MAVCDGYFVGIGGIKWPLALLFLPVEYGFDPTGNGIFYLHNGMGGEQVSLREKKNRFVFFYFFADDRFLFAAHPGYSPRILLRPFFPAHL